LSPQIPKGKIQEVEADIIGLSEVNDTCHFLSSESVVYIIPATIFSGNPDDLIGKLPKKLVLKHINRRVLQISSVKETKTSSD